MSKLKDIQSFIPLNKIVKRAVLDVYGDYSKDEGRFTAWAIDGLKKLTRETLRSGKRYAVLNINKNLNNAVLPCDFKEEFVVALIDDCGEKIPLNINQDIVNSYLVADETDCDQPCEAKCNCFPKQMCADLQTTQVINKILINSTEYDETVTTTLLPNGEYYKVTTTPLADMVLGGVTYLDRKEYLTTFDLETCGCIKPTERNCAKVEALCWDVFCCYCTGCKQSDKDFGGYKIFYETGTIHFDGAMIYDKVYLEYRGSMPKSGNEYLVPEVAYDTLIEYTKYRSIANKKGVPLWERRDWLDNYTRERGNMNKVLGRISLADILHSALLVPKFDYNSNGCYTPSTVTRTVTAPALVQTNTVYVNVPSPAPPLALYPTIITVEGSQMTGGIQYDDPRLAGIPLRIFANPNNRFLVDGVEYTLVPSGGFIVTTGITYGAGDWFDVFPKWT